MKFYNWLGKHEVLIAKIALTVMTLLVFVQAVTRKFGHPISWAVDISTFLFAWVVFLGGDAAMRRDALVNIDMFVKKLSEKAQLNIRIINNVIIIIYLVTMIFYGIRLTITTYHRTFAGLPWLSFSWATASVPFGCLLMLFTTILKTKDILKEGGYIK
ncbi:TRAP transporter small permease subunit [Sedimentibacter sp.]|uniref:TRAP transporter small permease n=1 Tax=Sedimentibacter sp. TaxID=1960295 RepID=UPI0028B11DED|nr:TRAP transporter small permease subunit [Sedimentibacter sp.]